MKENEIINKSEEFHGQSMDLAELAMKAKKNGKPKEAKKLFSQAFELEKQAALLLTKTESPELTRAILFRSAAWIAFHAEKYREAERMAAYGLMGNPPDQLVKELREVLVATLSKLNAIELATAA